MHNKKLDKLVDQFQNYLECWKEFNRFIAIARSKKFSVEDEQQFLEVKSVIVQELELILGAIECSSPSRDDVHALIGAAPSLRYLSESNEANLRSLETQWHKTYVGFQALLGQIKVKQRQAESESFFGSLFKKKS